MSSMSDVENASEDNGSVQTSCIGGSSRRPAALQSLFLLVIIGVVMLSIYRVQVENTQPPSTSRALFKSGRSSKSRLKQPVHENDKGESKPYNLVVASTFKNESMLLGEWIQHYVDEGVDHFYLLDNGSPDDYMKLIQHFPSDMVTVVRDGSPPRMSLQDHLMNKYFTSMIIAEANWVLVVDVDEYVYPMNPTECISDILAQLKPNVHRVWLPWKVFGGNGHITQPAMGVVGGFTKRAPVNITMNRNYVGYGKSFARVGKQLKLLTHGSTLGDSVGAHYSNGTAIHHAPGVALNGPHILDDHDNSYLPLQLNHYMFQSREYYEAVKCVRGGGQSGHVRKYTMWYYNRYEPEANVLEDRGLMERYAHRSRACRAARTAVA